MDKSWIRRHRSEDKFREGVLNFLDFAFEHIHPGMESICCPCVYCNNSCYCSRDEVHLHILQHGFTKGYTNWIYHGEAAVTEPLGTSRTVEDNLPEYDDWDELLGAMGAASNSDVTNFYRLLEEAEEPLYPNCKNYSRLSFTVHLLRIKTRGGLANKWFDEMLSLLIKAFPTASIPKNCYEALKTIRDLGLTYEKIDACRNDCILFRKFHSLLDKCPVCHVCRWKNEGSLAGDESDISSTTKPKKKVAEKIVRYFNLKSRIQRWFMCPKTAPHMIWHKKDRIDDGILRHPADSQNWKSFDKMHPTFAAEPRNLRLTLATDGMNPFGNMTNPHSTWPVVLINNNLPPWMCMKDSNFILSMIISGPKSPGNDIDVYLQLLIEELKDLWERGILIYDASKKEFFVCRVALLGTISDFPALAMLSGWSTKGKYACPCCNSDPCSLRLSNGGKWCYMFHRRFLPMDHKWRDHKAAFNGKKEKRPPPKLLNGAEVLDQLDQLEQVEFGKNGNQQSLVEKIPFDHNWKKISIFQLELPYVSSILLFHSLDVMHIEKNVCDILMGTILKVNGKTKDNIKARFDLQGLGIRKDLWATRIRDKYRVPNASYVMSNTEKDSFCRLLKEIKVPDGYASNISRCVNLKERRLIGLKSHDCHVLMEHLLPIAIRGNLPDDVCEAVTELCMFFKVLCATVLNMADLEKLQDNIAITLCKLERIFPPSFFVVMMHLPIHLPEQAKVGGPVQYRWMYPIERYLRKLKCYVRNKAYPEGSMAKGQIIEESLVLIERHMNSVVTKFNQLGRNEDNTRFQSAVDTLSVFRQAGEFQGKKHVASCTKEEFHQMRFAVLKNCEEVHQYEEEHKALLEGTCHAHRKHTKEFPIWFERKISQLHKETGQVSEALLSLAGGPCREALSFNIYTVNGYRFHTKRLEQRRKTQNAGVCVTIEKDYFGVVTDIIELRYVGGFHVVLFKCEWRDVDSDRGCRKDRDGVVTAVNKTISCWQDEPYVLPSQVSQVMYVNEGQGSPWQSVIKLKPRNYYNIPVREVNLDSSPSEAAQDLYSTFSMEDVQCELQQDDDDNFVWDRSDVPDETIAYVPPEQGRGKTVDQDDADIESVYTTSDDDDLLEFEESDNEMDCD